MMPSTVVPAFPYEGALYWFLGQAGHRHSIQSRYYRILYGSDHESLSVRSAGLACLFDRIVLAPADHFLPDYQSYLSQDTYNHPDLRISTSWDDNEWAPENRAIASAVLSEDRPAQSLLDRSPLLKGDRDAQLHFLCRLALQIRLAARINAVIVADSFFTEAYKHVAPWISALVGERPAPSTISLSEGLLDVVGLEFAPSGLDAFAAIRGSREISKYAASFREAIAEARSSVDLQTSLLAAMREAMDSEEVAKAAAGAFQGGGSVMTVAGLIPFLGTAASLGGAIADAGGRIETHRAESHRWYLLGSKMQEVALKEALRGLR